MPPLLVRVLSRGKARREETQRFAAMYGRFVGTGDLCFDVGANLGNRVRAFRKLGCRVIAVEPQKFCLERLEKEFGSDPSVTLVAKALGPTEGKVELMTSSVHVLSTVSSKFIESTSGSGRFRGVRWEGAETVAMSTLDALIDEFGLPRFIKIDVEGFEAEVLEGLSQAVPSVSVEWTPEMADSAVACVERLMVLGDYEFNYSWGESMKFAREKWMDSVSVLRVIHEFEGENYMFGDIYARLKKS